MQATIDAMFLNEKIISKYLFCPFFTRNTSQMIFKRSIVIKKTIILPPCAPHSPLGELKYLLWDRWFHCINLIFLLASMLSFSK